MQALDLHIKHKGRIQLHAFLLEDEVAELALLFLLDGDNLLST